MYLKTETRIYESECERASNAYLMSLVGIIVGLPLPIINVIATFFYLLSQRKSTFFVRWHATQALMSQLVLVPFNSILLISTIICIQTDVGPLKIFYWFYLGFVLLLNLIEFIFTIVIADRVRKGHHMRWPILASITDSLVSKNQYSNSL
ncbi:DUF4870 domain-containing protein [Mesonia sediminis]|uniref:DUF4870 domain-containing protein n=1 Tax=Mesonia sediminis TaxID=1703946 RepID=A0ABW5SEX8_9FLAO